jgi:hypothetical protein
MRNSETFPESLVFKKFLGRDVAVDRSMAGCWAEILADGDDVNADRSHIRESPKNLSW